jgi:hypothetical protein
VHAQTRLYVVDRQTGLSAEMFSLHLTIPLG